MKRFSWYRFSILNQLNKVLSIAWISVSLQTLATSIRICCFVTQVKLNHLFHLDRFGKKYLILFEFNFRVYTFPIPQFCKCKIQKFSSKLKTSRKWLKSALPLKLKILIGGVLDVFTVLFSMKVSFMKESIPPLVFRREWWNGGQSRDKRVAVCFEGITKVLLLEKNRKRKGQPKNMYGRLAKVENIKEVNNLRINTVADNRGINRGYHESFYSLRFRKSVRKCKRQHISMHGMLGKLLEKRGRYYDFFVTFVAEEKCKMQRIKN